MKGFTKFISYVKDECKQHKVNFKHYKRSYVKLSDTVKCGGYFECPEYSATGKGTLAFSSGKLSMAIMVHEYAHMTQWLDKIPLWAKASTSLELLDKWLSGKNVKSINKHIDICKDLELDNEIRSVKLIKKWNLPIDVSKYTKEANAYILFYLYLKETRRWSVPGNSPYSVKEIVDSMSDKFDMNYKKLDPKIRELFIKHNI